MPDGYILSKTDAEKIQGMYRKLSTMHAFDRPQPYQRAVPTFTAFRRFELSENTSTPSVGASYAAQLQTWSGSAWVTSSSTGDAITVYDELGQYRAADGALGLARKMPNSGHWEIEDIQRFGLLFSGTLPGALASTDASIAGVTLVAIDGGSSPEGTQTVYNKLKRAGASGKNFIAIYDQSASKYEFLEVENTSQTVVTDYQIDGATKKFQKKTRAAAANWEGSESAWTDVHTGGACP